jgi:hypothetical protein
MTNYYLLIPPPFLLKCLPRNATDKNIMVNIIAWQHFLLLAKLTGLILKNSLFVKGDFSKLFIMDYLFFKSEKISQSKRSGKTE